MYITYIMYTYSTLYLRVYQVHIWPRLPPFDGGCVSWSFSIAAVYYLVLGLVTYLAHGSLAENRLKETVGSCTAQLLIQSGLGAINGWFHTVGPHKWTMASIFKSLAVQFFWDALQVMICTQSSPKTWATWQQMQEFNLAGKDDHYKIRTGPHGVTITKGYPLVMTNIAIENGHL